MDICTNYWKQFKSLDRLQKFAVIFLVVYGIYYWPLSIEAGLGPQHLILMLFMIIVGCIRYGVISKALVLGTIFFCWQFTVAWILNDGIRWSTILYSFGLVYTYVGFYNLVYFKKIFSLDGFIILLKFIMLIAFCVCILQQMAILVGLRNFPMINLMKTFTEKGPLACNSLYHEMSTFARFMLVCYYGYVKCSEMKRGAGRFTPWELLRGEHCWITIRFLWMMLTMSSGTAMIALMAFSLYFIFQKNTIILISLLILGYTYLDKIENEQLQRSLRVIEATSSFDREQVVKADSSAAARIAPIINSFNADFSKKEAWFGHGVDYARNNDLFTLAKGTLFDDYGFILFLLGYIFSFSCAYKINSLAALFLLLGIGGNLGGNIQYSWELAMIMTVVRFFIEQDRMKKCQSTNVIPI